MESTGFEIDPQPLVQIDPVESAGFGYGVEHGRMECSPGGAEHGRVVAAHDGIAKAQLHAVVVHEDERIVQEKSEPVPVTVQAFDHLDPGWNCRGLERCLPHPVECFEKPLLVIVEGLLAQ